MQLLRQLYAIHSETGHEWPMIQFVREYVSKNIPKAIVLFDKLGNLYITKGEAGIGYPTLACHLDQVQKIHSEDFEVRQDGDILYGWSEQNQLREGLGLMLESYRLDYLDLPAPTSIVFMSIPYKTYIMELRK